MKKIFIYLFITLIALPAVAQRDMPSQLATATIPNKDAKFLLFPTQNINIFLKLNTSTGEVYMVQYSTKGEQIEIKIDSYLYPLVEKEEQSNGRFYLYPTTNFYNFILLDQIDGRVWQLQWSIEKDQRMLIRIFGDSNNYSAKDGIFLKDLEYKNHVYYKDGNLFNGEAFVDNNGVISQSFMDGRVRFKGGYFAHHKNGIGAFAFTLDTPEIYSFYDEDGNKIEKEVFEAKYPEIIQGYKSFIAKNKK